MVNHYLLRLNDKCVKAITDGFDQVLKWVRSNSDACIGSYEYVHDNHHYHFWIISKATDVAIKKNFKRTFPGFRGNQDFSWRCQEGNLEYICKGPTAISKIKDKEYPGVKEYPRIIVDTMYGGNVDKYIDAHEAWWKTALDLKSKVVHDKPKAEEKPTFFESVLKWWEEDELKKKCKVILKTLPDDAVMSRRLDVYNKVAKLIAIGLMKKFKTLKKLYDLPIIKKYTNMLIVTVISEEELLEVLWLRGDYLYSKA